MRVACGWLVGGFGVAWGWLRGAYRLASNTLGGGFEVSLMWLWDLPSLFLLSAFAGMWLWVALPGFASLDVECWLLDVRC